MSAPLPLGIADGASGLALATAIGVAFGFALERAGLGSAKKLAAQFDGRDFAVIRVMFTAILTALGGIELGLAAGWIDPDLLPVPETFLGPQLVGGLLFGVGLAVAGLCPGTSCVAAASGRRDGFAVVAGLFAGVLVTGFAPLAPFYASGARGRLRLPEALGLPEPAVVALVVAVALVGFALAARIERHAEG